MVNDCSTMEYDGDLGESSFTSSDALAAAQHQLGTVPAGPGEYAEAEGVEAWQREEVGSLVESLGVAD